MDLQALSEPLYRAKLKTYFTITGILTLIGLVVGLLGFVFGLGTAMVEFAEVG